MGHIDLEGTPGTFWGAGAGVERTGGDGDRVGGAALPEVGAGDAAAAGAGWGLNGCDAAARAAATIAAASAGVIGARFEGFGCAAASTAARSSAASMRASASAPDRRCARAASSDAPADDAPADNAPPLGATPDNSDGMVGSRGVSGVQSSLRLPRLSGLALLSRPSDVQAEGFACESAVLASCALEACAAVACDTGADGADGADAGICDADPADAAAATVDAVGVAGDTFSKSYVSVSLSAASNSSITSRIVRGRRFGSFANICMTRVPSRGGICRVGTRVGTRSSIARFLSKCG